MRNSLVTYDSPEADGDGLLRQEPTSLEPESDFSPTPAPHRPPPASAGWWAIAVLWRVRWWLVGMTLLIGVVAAWISLLLPEYYHAETRVLLPNQEGTSLAGLVETVAPGASSLIGGAGGGDYTRYRTILASHTIMARTVEHFDLIRVYQTSAKRDPLGRAISRLRKNVEFEVSLEYDYLAVHVTDESPTRSAQMADYFVSELNRENIRLQSGNAAENRAFLGERLRQAELALDSAQQDMQRFMERNEVVGIEAQAEALVGALATAQAQVAEAEIRFRAIQTEYGPETTEYAASQEAVRAAREQVESLAGGRNAVLPVPMQRLPALSRQYASIQQELITQTKIIEVLRPMFEQARMAEQRQAKAVQVIDPARVPIEKAGPRRTVIVLVSILTGFLLLALAALLRELVRTKAPVVARNIALASGAHGGT